MVEVRTLCCGEVICTGETVLKAVQRAITRGISLKYANLEGADLRDGDLRGARLYRASLINAQVKGLDMTGADISGAHFVEGSTTANLLTVMVSDILDMGITI